MLRSLLRNPVLLAPALGLALGASGWVLPDAAQRIVGLLAASAGPCALLSLGLFLARGDAGDATAAGSPISPATPPAAPWRRVAAIAVVKLVVQPAVTALFAVRVFGLAPLETQLVVLLSALPTGTGAFVLAGFYRRDAAVTSLAILVTTVASAATLPVVLWLLR